MAKKTFSTIKRKNFWFIFAVAAVVMIALGWAAPAHAGAGGLFGGVVFWIVRQFVDLISVFTTWAMMISGTLLDYVTSANFNNQPLTHGHIVDIGWSIVRDFANMFFILILLASAFATMLNLENYNIRKILPTLVVVALLVNFTKVIAGVFVDAAQIIMIWFLTTDASGGGSIALILVHGVGLEQFFTLNDQAISQMTLGQSQAAQLVNSIAYVIFSGYFAMILFFLSVMLVLRIAVLWVLVIFAPLAFVSYILPNAKFVFDNWWKYFLNYTFFGPIMAFFLFLAVIIAVQIGDLQQWVGYQASEAASMQSTFLTGPFILQYLVVMIFLWRGYKFSQQMSIWGADWGAKQMTKVGDKAWGAIKGIGGLPWRGAKFGAKMFETRYLAGKSAKIPAKIPWIGGVRVPLAPRALYRGVKAAMDTHERQALAEPIGLAQDMWNKAAYGRGTFYAQEARQKEVAARKKEKESLGVELFTLLPQLENDLSAAKPNSSDVEATIRLMMENNYEDDLMQWLVSTEKGNKVAEKLGIEYKDLEKYGEVDSISTAVTLRRILGAVGIKGVTQDQVMSDLGEISSAKGIYGNLALARYINETEAQNDINKTDKQIDTEFKIHGEIKDLKKRISSSSGEEKVKLEEELKEKLNPPEVLRGEQRISAMHWAAKMATAKQPRTLVGNMHPRTLKSYSVKEGGPTKKIHRMGKLMLSHFNEYVVGQEKYTNIRTKNETRDTFKEIAEAAVGMIRNPYEHNLTPGKDAEDRAKIVVKFAKGLSNFSREEIDAAVNDVVDNEQFVPKEEREKIGGIIRQAIIESSKMEPSQPVKKAIRTEAEWQQFDQQQKLKKMEPEKNQSSSSLKQNKKKDKDDDD